MTLILYIKNFVFHPCGRKLTGLHPPVKYTIQQTEYCKVGNIRGGFIFAIFAIC